jgi:CMP-N-acetylneuraminic acid synthetase
MRKPIATSCGFMSQLMIQQSKQLLFCAQVIDRPALLSGDFEPTTTCNVLESIHDEVENVIVLQPTNPLRPKIC